MKRFAAGITLACVLLAPLSVLGQAQEEDTIQLNFNGVSLKEVVKAVEKISGKRFLFDEALIANKRVSLFSSHPFPVGRVMEVFESILEVEGLTVVKSGEPEAELWKIVDLASALKRPTPMFRKENLESLRPGDQIVTLLLPLEHAAAEDAALALKSMASLPEGIVAVPGTNMVRVTDFAANAKRIAALIDQIDKEGPRMGAETVVLEHMDPVDLVAEIRPLIDIENRLEVSRLQKGVQQQIQRIMGSRARNLPRGMIQISGAQYAPVVVTPVPRLGAVIVSAEEARLPKIVDLIKRLDVTDARQRIVKYYNLKHADPMTAAGILSGIFDISMAGLAGGRGARRVKRAGPSRTAEKKIATIIPDQDLKVLVVVAPAKIHAEIEDVLKNIDRAGPSENVLKIYTLEHADVHEIANVVARLFGLSLQAEAARMRMISMARARRGGPVITTEEIVIPDENLNALLVVAPPPLHEKVVEALSKIDVEGPGTHQVKSYALDFADPDEVAATLGSLFDITVGGVSRGRRGGRFRIRSQTDRSAVIVSNRSQNKVMVSASDETHKEIAEIVRDLDVEGPNDIVVQYIPVENGDVQGTASIVSQIFGLTLGSTTSPARRGRGSRAPLEQNVVIPDENLGSLIVVAPKAIVEKIEEAVKKIDVAGPGEKVVCFYKVEKADVDEVARIIAGIFEIELQTAATSRWRRGRRTPTPSQRNAVVIPHPELSTVVVVAPKTTQEEVEKVIRQIDAAGPQENQLRYYTLENADLTETANVLSLIFGFEVGSAQRAFRGRGRAGQDGKRVLTDSKVVIPDENLNSLIVVAPSEVQAEVEKAIARLDVLGPLENELRFYEVDDDFTDTTAQTLAQIFNIPVGSASQARRARSTRSGQRVKFGADPVIIPDAAFGSIIVNAPAEIHEQVQKVLEQLQVLGKRERMAIRFYRLKNTDAEDIASKIGSLFNITVTNVTAGRASPARRTGTRSSPSTRRTTGAGRGADAATPEKPGPDEEELPPEEPSGAKEYSWGGEPVVVPDKNLNSIIVIAPEYLHTEIETILLKLDVRRPQVLFEVAIIDITADRDLDLGIEFSTIDPAGDGARGHGLTSFGIGTRPNNPAGGFPMTTTVPGGEHGIFAGISKGAAGSLPVLVKLLQENSDVNIRSTPLLLVNDNEEAEFSSLRSEPTTSTSQGTATTRISFSGFVEAGTVLRITPHVSEGNYIRLEISLQVDSWLGSSTTPGIPPPKATNSLDTYITVPNERTVIIGGLSSLTRAVVIEKVPLLGDIPILGWLFRREITREESTKLFLFIKPTILSDEKFVDLNRISERKVKEAEEAAKK